MYCLLFFCLQLLLITLWYLWPLYCLSFFALRLLLITLWYLLAIVLSSVILRFTATSDYPLVSFGHYIVCHSSLYGYISLPFGIFWTLHCLSFFALRLLLITLWYLWPLYCLSFFALRLLLITLWYLLAIVLSSVNLRFTATSDYPLVSFGHYIVCHSSLYGYISLPFGIFWTLHCLSFFALRLLLITLWYLLDIALSVFLRFTATSDYPLVSFGHCIVCHSSLYGYF